VERTITASDLRLDIKNQDSRLAARLLLPAASNPPAVVFVHGLGSGKDSPRNVVIAERLRETGIAALLFDLRGHGESSAELHGDSMHAYQDDLVAAFDWLRSRGEVDAVRIGIAGSSLGGVVALDALREQRVSPVSLLLRAPPISVGDLEAVSVPTLVLVGSLDPLSPRLDLAQRSPHVHIKKIEGAGHLFEEPGMLQRALDETVKWFRATLAASIGAKEGR
jgi:alpha-beta hydrolase superfamily lysophospholipase